MALIEDTKVSDGTKTSFLLISTTFNAKSNAAVPLSTATHSVAFVYFLNKFSNFFTFPTPVPEAQKPLFRVLIVAFISKSSIVGKNNFIIFN